MTAPPTRMGGRPLRYVISGSDVYSNDGSGWTKVGRAEPFVNNVAAENERLREALAAVDADLSSYGRVAAMTQRKIERALAAHSEGKQK